eukprot:CAMPEP_0185032668 /NCGR_PEP_ID=MMETSP1103-20130426/20931_1 /TAXON_ID=36769 /ORGANISM="Paraphysomonas bandaiensis, Strain Caron Lab Isolate" /LENGTH=131 /DNA_ID=CAMNT_0027568647 /DNA_START=191 /DNA_END=586 /DNA_ORIENTATION=+
MNSSDMEIHELDSMEQIKGFPLSKWGIPEPPDTMRSCSMETCTAIDLVLVPGVAFDRNCGRVGHGRGYYDCFLEALSEANISRQRRVPLTVGLGFDDQLLDEVPLDEHDRVLDFVATPSGLYSCATYDGIL